MLRPNDLAVARGVIIQLLQETTEEIANNYARIIQKGDIKNSVPKK